MEYRVGIDGRSLSRAYSGMATYVENLLIHISELDRFDPPFPGNNFLWNQIRVPLAALRRGWSVYHAPSYTGPLANVCPTVLSVHDVSYLVRDDWYPYTLGWIRKSYYRASLKRSDRILVPSEFSKNEVTRLFPELNDRIRKIRLGVSDRFRSAPTLAEDVRRRLGLPERFLLHVGDIHPRRNVPEIAAAADQMNLPLVLVGRLLKGGEVPGKPAFLYSGLSQEQLVGAYNAATVLVCASLYEGFGLPILEAMACGLPVVASNRASIPEVCGDAAVLVEPHAEAIASGVKEILDSREKYVSLGRDRARQFGWEKTAEQTVKVYQELF